MSASISLKYSVAAVKRASATASRVQPAVTKGLPSRSPAIQEEKRNSACSTGMRGCPMLASALSRRRRKRGTPAKMVSWK